MKIRTIYALTVMCLALSPFSWAQFAPMNNPTGLIMDSDLNVWATSFSGNQVFKFQGDGSGGLLGSGQFGTSAVRLGIFGVGSNPTKLACDCAPVPNPTGTIWVTNFSSNNVTRLDMKTGANLGTFSVGAGPRGLTIDATSVWVANSVSNNITRLDKQTGNPMGTYSAGSAPYDVETDGRNIWIANRNSNNVMKFDGLSAPPGASFETILVAPQPQNLFWDGQNMWITSYSGNTLTKITSTGAKITAAMPAGPLEIADDGCSIWVISYASSRLTRVDRNTGQPLEFFLMPTTLPNPYGLVVRTCFSHPIATSYTNNFMGAFALVD